MPKPRTTILNPWQQAELFCQQLEQWFLQNRRPLPWREKPDLYGTVVSEFMLQQTQVATVLPYYYRWMAAFPDFASLANASEASVLKHWEGLGYYQRARNLHRLARIWLEAAVKPANSREWLAYPGVGNYTAAAIASIVYGEKVAVVDGNVVRILTRLLADATPYANSTEAAKALRPQADALVLHAASAGVFNEAVMELGAVLCRKRNPLCHQCPVRGFCAGSQSKPEDYPQLAARIIRKRSVHRAWVVRDGRILLQCGHRDGKRLRNIWELPLLAGLSKHLRKGRLLLTRTRAISNERIEEKIYRATIANGFSLDAAGPDRLGWFQPGELNGLTLSGPHRRWLAELWQSDTEHSVVQ